MSENHKNTVYLVDGSLYIHRAYHAIRNLSNSKGFPTNIIFGFTKMLLKLLEDKEPEHLALIFDSKGKTFRHAIYKDYKANRPPMPDDMAVQIPVIKEVIKNMNIRMIEMQGYEADDLIGTLARILEEKGYRVVMITGDKDYRQLVTQASVMWDSMKDNIIDYSFIKENYGFEPVKFIDVMALSGDSSDNIPGVAGIGEKTAVELIRNFGSFEGVFENIDNISRKKLKENLLLHYESALLSRQLVTIDRFAPVKENIEDFKVGSPNNEALAKIFREYEFRGLWDQFASRKIKKADYSLILSMDSLKELAEHIKDKGFVSLDTETTGLNPMEADIAGVSFSCEEGKAYYLPVGHMYLGVPDQIKWTDALTVLKDILEDENIFKIGQNIKFDAEILKTHGIDLKGIGFDTMIASYVLNPGLRQHNLDYLAQHYLNHKMISYEEVTGKGKNALNFSEIDLERAMEYSSEDADITLRVKNIIEIRLKEDRNEDLFYNIEMKLIPVLMDMEMTGIKIDSSFFKEMSVNFATQIKETEKEIFKEASMEFNINSPQQLGFVLFEKLGLPVQGKTSKTKNFSTDVKVLTKLSSLSFKVPSLILRYRTLSKLKSTYLDSLIKQVSPRTGRVHTSYNQTVTATGRLSSSNPNLQNIPIRNEEGREIRKGFIAEEGKILISADYSQVELRIFAHYSKDAAFIEAFRDNQDIHARTAAEIWGVSPLLVSGDMRRIAKAINFGIIYGMGANKLSGELGIDTKTAKKYIDTYYDRYKGVQQFKENAIESARKSGYATTLLNRRRYLPDINHSNNMMKSEAERMAVNTPIQGTAADLIKKAMINIHSRFARENIKTKMLLQVHDELVFEGPESELENVIPLIREEMEEVYRLDVPLLVDIRTGKNWDEAH